MKILDLFSGIGGFSLAGHQMNWETVAFVEREPFAQKVLRKRFPDVPIFDDIFTFDGTKFKGTIDVICGGFPAKRTGFVDYPELRMFIEERVARTRAGVGGRKMTLSELIEKIGNENIRFHWMDECTTNVNWGAKKGLATITLKSDQPVTPRGFRDVGILIWLPREETERLLSSNPEPAPKLEEGNYEHNCQTR